MPAGDLTASRRGHHALPEHEVVLVLGTDPRQGLSEAEARQRLSSYGPNLLPHADSAGAVVRFARQFHNPLVYVLLAAGGVTVALNEVVEAAVIFGVVLVNAVVGFVQESKAEAALDALRSMVRTTARVRRDGEVWAVDSEELVPGDVVLVEAGDKVPADVRILELTELRVDESALTGESAPVTKDEVALPADTPVADRRNMVYSGTLVTGGSGAGVVVATGGETELGEIHRLVGAAEPLATPLTRRLARFSRVLTVVILALAAVTFAVGMARGEPAADMFTASVALAVGAIPEGLPAAVTITLAIGVARMARRRAVVRRLPVVETLGSTTVICTDKTGTLTENQMTVQAVWTLRGQYAVTGVGYDPTGSVTGPDGRAADLAEDLALLHCLQAGALCNDAVHRSEEDDRWTIVGDPTEGALLVAAVKGGLDPTDQARSLPRVGTIPFSSERQFMATIHQSDGEESLLVLAKGSAERILGRCSHALGAEGTPEPLDAARVLGEAAQLAAGGLRVLATATGSVPRDRDLDDEPDLTGLTFTGLQAMLDPPRPAAIGAVASCHTAGVVVKMITGDHAATAAAIAREVGILDTSEDAAVVTGQDLDRLPASDIDAAIDRALVFARVSPEQKLRLVDSMQGQRHVVAMTGDGVNDAPALRQADIGVAMGRSGTDVAKEAADMVLTDDDFATIEAAVEEGRGVFDNLTKFIVWTLPTNIGEGMVILVAIALGTALPILPVQILWINMTTAVLLGLMLAFEPKEAGIMSRPPRDPQQPLLTRTLVVRILLVSAVLVGAALWIYEWELGRGAGQAEARTAAVNLFVTVEALYLVACRSLTRSVWAIGPLRNRWVLGGLAAQAVAQLALTYLPAMNRLFATAPIGADVWARILGLGLLASAVVAVHKRVAGARM